MFLEYKTEALESKKEAIFALSNPWREAYTALGTKNKLKTYLIGHDIWNQNPMSLGS